MKIVVGKYNVGNVSCLGHCKDDFGDIRFIGSDNATVLSYWIENLTFGYQAIFWVKLPVDISSGTINLYYDNVNVTTESNGSATFLAFINTTQGWTGDTQVLHQVGNKIRIVSACNSQVYYAISPGNNSDICVDAKITQEQNSYLNLMVSDGTGNANDFSALVGSSNYNGYFYGHDNGYSGTLFMPFTSGKAREWREVVRTYDQLIDYYLYEDNGSLLASEKDVDYAWSSPTVIDHIRLSASSFQIMDATINWIRVRKYVSPEPILGAPGSQHSQ